MSGDIFGCHDLVGGPYWPQEVGARGVAKHPAMHRITVRTKSNPAPDVGSTEAEKHCHRVSSYLEATLGFKASCVIYRLLLYLGKNI